MAIKSRVKTPIQIYAETSLKRFEFNKICKSLLILAIGKELYDEMRPNTHSFK